MKLRLSLPALALLSLALAACGASKQTGSASRAASAAVTSTETSGAAGRATPSPDSEEYRDGDDETVLTYGHAASAADGRAIGELVKRYYAAAAAGDGASACALTSPAFAKTVPEDYGQELGPAAPPGAATFLRGARTCAAVLSLLFEHSHSQLAAPIDVTGVRVQGDYAYALVGSATLPASFIEAGREGHAWKIDGLLGRPVP